ncbi:hypothetical protein CHS0354_012860 [Potamilus streckersoni]|uniref:Major facilitator superfamily (MFS) profile domain-containing protein n=1 Tax=Potamilus streckersoni TaxID=2493646 RepID=A0AAE0W3T7_9BIVA|nr:hypothetical protein CHS0354_012860 [Potamilus streckersoni]
MEGNNCECSNDVITVTVTDRTDKRNAKETSEANFSDKNVVTIPTEGSKDRILIEDKEPLERKDSLKFTTSENNGGKVLTIANATEEDPNKPSPPDGGWGWFVVLGSALIHILLGGFERSSGVLFLELRDRFGQSASATAWVSAIFSTCRLMMGPLASAMCHRFTIRFVVFVGSLLFALGVLITGYAPSLTVVYILYGLLGGFGSSFIYAPSLIIVSQYFNKKRGLAVGLSAAGVGLGTFLLPPLFGVLFDHYGFQGACLILSGITLNAVIAAFLFRPVPVRSSGSQARKEQKNGNSHAEQEHLLQTVQPEFCVNSAKPESCCIKPMTPENETDIPVIFRNGGNVKSNEGNLHSIRQKSRLAKTIQFAKTFIAINNLEPQKKKPFLELSLLKNVRFLSLCIAIALFTMAFNVAFVFLPPLIKERGMTELEAAYIVSIAGAMDAVGRILSGFILDLKNMKKYRLLIYNGIMFVVGTVSLLVPSISTFPGFALICAFYGLLIGAYVSQKSIIIIDILGVDKLTSSFGLLLWFQGVGTLIGPPISGFLKDFFGIYDGAFYLGGVGMLLGAAILLAGNVWKICSDTRSKNTETEIIVTT